MKLEYVEGESEKKQASLFKIPVIQPTAAAAIMYGFTSIQRERSKLAHQQHEQQQNRNQRITEDGRIASWVIADLLKKDGASKSNKSFKLFPYMCVRCKKEIVLCDSPTQTGLDETNYDRVINARPRSIFADPSSITSSSPSLLKSKSLETNLSDFAGVTQKSNDQSSYSKSTLQII